MRNDDGAEPYVRIAEAVDQQDWNQLTSLASENPWDARRAFETVLLVGDVASEANAGADLPPLPGAAREIETLSGIYRGVDVRLLRRRGATADRVLDALPVADVAHFGLHAVQDICESWRSALALSPQQSGSSLLPADRIRRLRLTRTRLVVLAACETYCGRICPSEGPESLASAFLAAGVPAVVGSLWPVDDESTSRLFIRFHRELRRGADALTALRTTQLAEIAAHPDDWTWASFQVVGGAIERTPGDPVALRSGARKSQASPGPAQPGSR